MKIIELHGQYVVQDSVQDEYIYYADSYVEAEAYIVLVQIGIHEDDILNLLA